MKDWKVVGGLDSGESREGAQFPVIFSYNWGSKSRKKFFRDRPPPLIGRSGSEKERVGRVGGGRGAYNLGPLGKSIVILR